MEDLNNKKAVLKEKAQTICNFYYMVLRSLSFSMYVTDM